MNAGTSHPVFVRTALVKLRLAALLPASLLGACRHDGRAHRREWRRHLRGPQRLPDRRHSRRDRRHHLVQPRRQHRFARDRRHRDDHRRARDLRRTPATTSFRPRPSRSTALRRDAGPARQVVLPYFDVAMQGGSKVVAKQIGQVGAQFRGRQTCTPGPGPRRRSGSIAASRPCRRTSARTLTRPRKAGDAGAAIDPMTDPAIRTAVAHATFEHLVGFQLTQDQLATTLRARSPNSR